MKKVYVFLGYFLLVISTWAFAEEAELLDAYLEDLPGTDSNIVVDQPQTVKYRRVETADGSELYEAIPQGQSVTTNEPINQNSGMNSDHAVAQEDLEIIELEPDEEEIVVIEAPDVEITQTGVTSNTVSGPVFCQQNPYARECLLSKYLSLCKKDPQSVSCKSELEKFDRFCGIFPNAYKCKKAKIAASCKKNPDNDECRTFTQRYCQKFPKAIFCNYN